MVLAPQRLPYEIQMASGWDKGFPPEELVGLMQTSAGKGWHTPRFGGYPQDLVLRFSCGHSRIRKIQILSHQYKIASRLDFWMGARKGIQSINADGAGLASPANRDMYTDRENNYRSHEDDTYESEDNGLDFVPGMDMRKKSLPVLQFQKLGSISFDSNSLSNYSGRELKSINVDVEGEYLRVVIRQCHVNPLNIYHQVAILALNVLGEPLEDELHGESERVNFHDYEVVNGPGQGLTEASFAHSLIPVLEAPDVPNLSDAVHTLSIAEHKDQQTNYMDQEVQKLVSGFMKAKQDAVKVEDFASAKIYKTGYEDMIKFANEIQTLDIEKHNAAENDEFDLAQELKAKVAEVKARMNTKMSHSGFFITSNEEDTFVSLTAPGAVEDEGNSEKSLLLSKNHSTGNVSALVDKRNTSSGSIGINGRRIPVSRTSIPPLKDLNSSASTTSDNSSDPEKVKRSDYSGKIPQPFSRSQSNLLSKPAADARYSGIQSAPRSTPSPRAGSKSLHQTNVPSDIKERSLGSSIQPVLGQDEIDIIHLDELTGQEQISFAVSLQVFSSKVVSCLLSRELNLRLYAIEHVKEYLENENVEDDIDQQGDRTLLARAVFQVISIALTDTREKVITIALALLDQVVKFCLQNEIPSSVTYRSLEPIFSLLLVKASDLNTRVAQSTIDKIVMLCNCFRTPSYAILPLVFKPARSTVPYRQSQSRIEIVARLVNEFGVYDRTEGKGTPGGLHFESITEFAIPYLSHTNGEVRVATRKLIIDVCKFLNKTRVEQFLPGVKPLLIESIQKELVPKMAKAVPAGSPAPSSPVPRTVQTSRLSVGASGPTSTSSKRRQVPTSLGVDLHMDSLKSLLVEPDSPGLNRPSRQTSRQRSDAAIAHQARLKMPLRSSIKATQALYSGVPRSMIKRQSALSPDDENDSTASEETKPPIPQTLSVAPRTAVRPLQPKTKSSSSLTSKGSQQNLASGRLPGSGSQKRGGPVDASRSAKDRFCVFCDERSSAFTDEGLVVHYWNDCAMLANCSSCKIIIEVPTLSDHMLKECAKRKFVKQCETCREIMAADSFLAHVAAGCFAVPETTVRCPLCQFILPSNEEATWKQHLLTAPGCPMNKKTHSSASQKSKSTKTSLQPRTGGSSSASNLLPPVNTTTAASAHRYTDISLPSIAPMGSPTSPLSSSSSSSMRIDSSSGRHHRGPTFSATVSPASSTASSVVDNKPGIASVPVLTSTSTSISTSPNLGQRMQQQGYAGSSEYLHYQHEVSHASPLCGQRPVHQLHHQESIHPLDPSPVMPMANYGSSTSTSTLSHTTLGSLSSHSTGGGGGSGSSSRIPKLGSVRSSPSNSVSSMAWK
ncbi:hypothetical protein EDD21DRAFT_29775 [Dissophora ornata]|nr:hypothetical protein EDD21DRAFT_29775 [Dissophora ornata]